MKLLAFDPGSTYTGWCLVRLVPKVIDGNPPLNESFVRPPLWGTLKATENGSMAVWVRRFIQEENPTVLACEKSFPGRGTSIYAPNFERTAEVRGVIKSFVRPEVQFFELSAQEVRSALKIKKPRRIKATGKMVRIAKPLRGVSADVLTKRAVCTYTGIAEADLKTSHEVDAVALAFVVCSRLGISWR